jgi:hypothetical protein
MHANVSNVSRQVSRFVVGAVGKTGGTTSLTAILTLPGRTQGTRTTPPPTEQDSVRSLLDY